MRECVTTQLLLDGMKGRRFVAETRGNVVKPINNRCIFQLKQYQLEQPGDSGEHLPFCRRKPMKGNPISKAPKGPIYGV